MSEKIEYKLNDEQYKCMREAFLPLDNVDRILSKLVMQLAKDLARDEEKHWAAISEMMGLSQEEFNFRVNWLSRTVIATPREDCD